MIEVNKPKFDCLFAYLEDAPKGSVSSKSTELAGVADRKGINITCKNCGACAVANSLKVRAADFKIHSVDLVVCERRKVTPVVTTCHVFSGGIPTHIDL